MSYKYFFVRNSTLSDLKLNGIEYGVLNDIKRVIYECNENCSNFVPLFENYNEKDFDEFFMSLGSKRVKRLM
ncbi:P52 family lipoprotein (plasmid) [Borreliella turdi]|uniref:P52 family lipoprotein n=1 Tax=Borreliella turdi TaxID=57863 RepID=UPI003AEFA716